MRVTLRRSALLLAAPAVAIGVAAAIAHASSTVCNVAASAGYANCLSVSNPTLEQVRSQHVAGRPYRFQLHRPSDGALWGWWEWNDGNHHTVFLSLSGSITAQVDNRGSGTTAYDVTLDP